MNNYVIILIIIILLLLFVYLIFRKNNDNVEEKIDINPQDKIVWAYWENKDGYIPTHIKLCFETFEKHLKPKYKLIILNEKTVKKYLPGVRNDLNNLMIAQKVDYYRIALLHKYGGIWIDADTIIMRDFDEIFDKIASPSARSSVDGRVAKPPCLEIGCENGGAGEAILYDFVGFGCTQTVCFDGKDQPSNGVLAARKNSKLMKLCLDKLNKKLDEKKKNDKLGYFDLGKYVIWDALKELKKDGYDYYHFPSSYDGTRDINGYWLDTNRHFSEEDIKLIDENKPFFIFLTNAGINKYQPWVKKAKREELLNGKYWISKMFRKALK